MPRYKCFLYFLFPIFTLTTPLSTLSTGVHTLGPGRKYFAPPLPLLCHIGLAAPTTTLLYCNQYSSLMFFDIFAYEQFLNAVVVFQKGASKYLKSKFVGESIYVLPTPPPSMRRRGVRDDLHVSLIRRGAIAQQFGMNIRFRKK